MFFALSKILGFLSAPSNLFVVIGLIGTALLPTRFVVVGHRLVVASMLLIASIGILPIGNMLAQPLEARFPPLASGQSAPTGIIVLGGAIYPNISATRGQVALTEAAERMTSAVELARQYPNARIAFIGGNGQMIGGVAESNFAIRLFESLGVARGHVTVEAQSRSTAENAFFAKKLLAPQPGERWLLVTSAMHMPRAIGVFRQAGFSVLPYPVDYQTTGSNVWALPGLVMSGIRTTDAAIHEWLGLLAYRIGGRTSELFPGPPPG